MKMWISGFSHDCSFDKEDSLGTFLSKGSHVRCAQTNIHLYHFTQMISSSDKEKYQYITKKSASNEKRI